MAFDKIRNLENKLETLRKKPDRGVWCRKKVDTLNDLARELKNTDPAAAERFAEQALNYALTVDYQKGIARSYLNIGISYDLRGHHEKAKEYHTKSLRASQKAGDRLNIARCNHNLGVVYRKTGDFKRALVYERKALRVFRLLGHKKYIANVYCSMGNTVGDQGNHEMALDFFFKALKVARRIRDTRHIAIIYSNLSVYFTRLRDHENALKYLYKSLRISKKLDFKRQVAIAFINLGTVYGELGDRKRELEYTMNALQTFRKMKDERCVGNCLSNIGSIYREKGDYRKALEYHSEALRVAEGIRAQIDVVRGQMYVGADYACLGKYKRALEHLGKALETSEMINYKEGICMNSINVGEAQMQLKHYKEASGYLQRGLRIAREIKAKDFELECYHNLCQLHEAQGQYRKALAYHKEYTDLMRKSLDADKDKRIAELKIRYDTTQKEMEAEVHRLKNVALRREVKQRKRAERQLQERRDHLEEMVAERTSNLEKEILERKKVEQTLLDNQKQLRSLVREISLIEEKQRRKFASFLHDDISQALALATFKLRSVQETRNDKNANAELAEIRTIIDKTAERTRTLAFEISPPILYELGLEPALEWLVRQFGEHYSMKCQFKDDGLQKPLPDEASVFLFQSVRELLANVAKHAHAHSVTVSVNRDGSSIRAGVEDDGIGFDLKTMNKKRKKSGGFGLFNVRERLRYLRGHMEIQSKKGKGTTVTLIAPLRRTERKRTK